MGKAVLFLLFLFGSSSIALRGANEDTLKFVYPLDVPMSLSGNYGELRSNHFHSGIDFRIGGVPGAKVYATERGYVSKITVSSTGYGNALYITHPNGYVSVYGHLQKYVHKIQKFVESRQYGNEDFYLNIDLDSSVFPVGKFEHIAYAGNTGSSGGPHLHFEIRDTDNLSLNLFEHGILYIPDKTPPVVNRVAFMGYSKIYGADYTFPIERPKDRSAVIPLPMYSYVAVDAFDKQEGTNAKLAATEYTVKLDNTVIYRLKIGDVPFEEGRYINSLIDYYLKNKVGRPMIKSYVEPGNGLKYKISSVNDGLIVLPDTSIHKVEVRAADYNGNSRTFTYRVKRVDSLYREQTGMTPDGVFMAWYLPNIYKTDGFVCSIPQASLYRSIYFKADTVKKWETPYSACWQVMSDDIPLHSGAYLAIKYTGPDTLSSKAILASVSKNGRFWGVGGKVDTTGYMRARIYSFGTYAVTVDTIPPTVRASFSDGAQLKSSTVSFIIRDALSGIKKFNVSIDGHWVLAIFDAKTARLSVNLQNARIKRGVSHNLVLKVTDNMDNTTVVKRNFKW